MEIIRNNKGVRKTRFAAIILVLSMITFSGNSRIFSEEQPVAPPGLFRTGQNNITFLSMTFHDVHFLVPENYFFLSLKKRNDKTVRTGDSALTSILGKGRSDAQTLANILILNNPKISPEKAGQIVSLYIKEAKDEGINYDVAFSQMCLETGFLKFGGDVLPSQNNFCGLGVTGKGTHGLSFPTVQMGIRAHIQHLKAYASTENPKHKIVDSRFRYVKRGSVRDVEQLTGKWARDPHYGEKIKRLLKRVIAKKSWSQSPSFSGSASIESRINDIVVN